MCVIDLFIFFGKTLIIDFHNSHFGKSQLNMLAQRLEANQENSKAAMTGTRAALGPPE